MGQAAHGNCILVRQAKVYTMFRNYSRLELFLLGLGLLLWATPIHAQESSGKTRRAEVLVDQGVFLVSYNEVLEQPNWVSYTVRNIVKKANRKGIRFRTDPRVHTSDAADYYNNPWDRGHLAPAGSFTDSYSNLYATFSYLNIALQKDQLNRGAWAQLENQVRQWAKIYGPIEVRIELLFAPDATVLPTGATIPSAFVKRLYFSDGSTKCFEFLNEDPSSDWEAYQIGCGP